MNYTNACDYFYIGWYNDVIKDYYKDDNIKVIINVAKE